MNTNAKLYVKLKVGKGFLAKNIKVKDHDFKKLLYKSTDTFVSLTDLLYYFWYYRSEIKRSVRNTVFNNVDLFFDMQEESTSFPLNVEAFISSNSYLVSKLGNDIVDVYNFLSDEDREKFDKYLSYFDEYNKTSLAMYKMPIKDFKTYIEEYLKVLLDDKFRVNKKVFKSKLIINYK